MDSVIVTPNFSLIIIIIVCVRQLECGVVPENSTCVGTKTDSTAVKSTSNVQEARKKEEDLMSKILPMMVMPFMVQTTLLPMMLMSMKFMLAQSMILGKLAIILGAVTLLRNHLKNGGGLFSHNINIQSQSHHHDLSHQNYALEGGPNSGPYKKGTRKKRAAEILLN